MRNLTAAFFLWFFIWQPIQAAHGHTFRSIMGRTDWILWASSEVPSLFLESYLTGTDLPDLLRRYYEFIQKHHLPTKPHSPVKIEFHLPPPSEELFILEEISGPLALLRGFWGRDCATIVSPFYVLSPRERIFRIRSRINERASWKTRGYIQGTEISLNPQAQETLSTLYIHTMNGPHLNAGHVHIIIEAIQKAHEALGINNVALTADDFLRRQQNNYPELRNEMRHLVHTQNRDPVPIYYIDNEFRHFIDLISPDAIYDQATANPEAVILDPLSSDSGQNLQDFRIHFEDFVPMNSSHQPLRVRSFSPLNIYLLVLLLHQQSKRHDYQRSDLQFLKSLMARHPLPGWNKDPRGATLLDLMENNSHRTVVEHNQAVLTYLGLTHDDLSDDDRNALGLMNLEARLKARDAFSIENQEETIGLVSEKLLKSNQEEDTLTDTIEDHLDLFLPNRQFRKYIRKSTTERTLNRYRLSLLVNDSHAWIKAKTDAEELLHQAIESPADILPYEPQVRTLIRALYFFPDLTAAVPELPETIENTRLDLAIKTARALMNPNHAFPADLTLRQLNDVNHEVFPGYSGLRLITEALRRSGQSIAYQQELKLIISIFINTGTQFSPRIALAFELITHIDWSQCPESQDTLQSLGRDLHRALESYRNSSLSPLFMAIPLLDILEYLSHRTEASIFAQSIQKQSIQDLLIRIYMNYFGTPLVPAQQVQFIKNELTLFEAYLNNGTLKKPHQSTLKATIQEILPHFETYLRTRTHHVPNHIIASLPRLLESLERLKTKICQSELVSTRRP